MMKGQLRVAPVEIEKMEANICSIATASKRLALMAHEKAHQLLENKSRLRPPITLKDQIDHLLPWLWQ